MHPLLDVTGYGTQPLHHIGKGHGSISGQRLKRLPLFVDHNLQCRTRRELERPAKGVDVTLQLRPICIPARAPRRQYLLEHQAANTIAL